jgi:hypothetical protein
MSDGASGVIRLELELQPETATHRWHAVVRGADGRSVEFDTPLALARHLASWNERTGEQRGLR